MHVVIKPADALKSDICAGCGEIRVSRDQDWLDEQRRRHHCPPKDDTRD